MLLTLLGKRRRKGGKNKYQRWASHCGAGGERESRLIQAGRTLHRPGRAIVALCLCSCCGRGVCPQEGRRPRPGDRSMEHALHTLAFRAGLLGLLDPWGQLQKTAGPAPSSMTSAIHSAWTWGGLTMRKWAQWAGDAGVGSQIPISAPMLGSCSPKPSPVASHPQWNSLFTPFLPSLLPLPSLPPTCSRAL